MVWARIDDAWWSHRKTLETSLAARGLWATALSWAGHQRTDELPRRFLAIVDADEHLAQELVDVGFWEPTERGWRIHDWRHYQDLSTLRAEAGSKGGKASAEARKAKFGTAQPAPEANGQANPKQETGSDLQEHDDAPEANAEATHEANAEAGTRPGPTRPDPTHPDHPPAPARDDFPPPPPEHPRQPEEEDRQPRSTGTDDLARTLARRLHLDLGKRVPDELTAALDRCITSGWTIPQLHKRLDREKPDGGVRHPRGWITEQLQQRSREESPARARERRDRQIADRQREQDEHDRRVAEADQQHTANLELLDGLDDDDRAELEAKARDEFPNPALVPTRALIAEMARLHRGEPADAR